MKLEAHDDASEVSITTARPATAKSAANDFDEVVLTPDGYAKLQEEHRRLTAERAEAAIRLSQALDIAGDLADNPEYRDAQYELDLVEERVALLEERLHRARLLRPDESSSNVVALGSCVALDDLDDGTREEYVLVSSAESNPAEGRISNESPVGRAIAGHHRGDVVDARAPHRVRHLRIADIRIGQRAA